MDHHPGRGLGAKLLGVVNLENKDVVGTLSGCGSCSSKQDNCHWSRICRRLDVQNASPCSGICIEVVQDVDWLPVTWPLEPLGSWLCPHVFIGVTRPIAIYLTAAANRAIELYNHIVAGGLGLDRQGTDLDCEKTSYPHHGEQSNRNSSHGDPFRFWDGLR
jgi:hypothetical protein